jgi:hypothetical protein
MPVVDRRRFITGVGAAVAGFVLVGVAESCGAGVVTDIVAGATGLVGGTVVDLKGTPQGIGRVYLLQKNGFNSGAFADVDASGKFDFGAVAEGAYLLRYWGSNRADVPEPMPNPVRITVAANAPAHVQFHVQVGASPNPDQEIYAGDFFFQQQPTGPANGTTVVTLGTLVCWYNVGQVNHTATGGPWGDSGPIAPDGNFMWTANKIGTFPYRCNFHGTQMIATLQVVA